ncbi:MAG TPA: S8 family serine peptidase [Candidatus Dormibacteraeota bacterium]
MTFRRLLAGIGTAGLTVLATGAGVGVGQAYAAGTAANYLVVFKSSQVPASAAGTIQNAGGTLVTSYAQIGVALARSDNQYFRSNLLADASVDDASATTGLGYKLFDGQAGTDSTTADGPPPGDLPNSPATDSDSLSPLQWDMRQIKTPQAHAITGGSPAVLIGDIDTGVDFNHPDLKQNLDVADSVNCVSGSPVPGLAAQDDNGHGTHTAGTMVAAANGFGIVGVAPNVRLAAIKSGDDQGFFFPESVVCGFTWAATHHVNVTNNSYFADPYLFNCRNDATQRAIWKAEDRAIRFAMQNGVSVVAAEGNESDDLAHPTQDVTSPDNTTPVTRPVTNACVVIPVEIPGVIGVTADGHNQQPGGGYLKSFYSSYGMGVTQVVAPGGDSVFGRNAEAPNGRVLSTYPANQFCRRSVKEPTGDPTYPTAVYCYLQGTSMASPHAAGTVALIISEFAKLNPGQVSAYLKQTADPQPCPASLPAGYAGFVSVSNGAPQVCTGGTGYNSWYGDGQVNALNAVTHTTH